MREPNNDTVSNAWDPSKFTPVPLTGGDCARRIRDLARRHGFGLSIRDAQEVLVKLCAQFCTDKPIDTWEPPVKDQDLFALILQPLHDWLAENGDPVPPRPDTLPRVPIIDLSEGPCEICAGWNQAKYIQDENGRTLGYRCDECGEQIPDMGLMRGRGFDGITPHHMHLRPINGTGGPIGKATAMQELCPECYRKHRMSVYPHESPKELERHLRV